MSLASSAVALIILVDLATGQGPPALQNYIAQEYRPPVPFPPPGFLPPPPPPPRNGYGLKEGKEYEKAGKEQEKLAKEYEKEVEKLEKEREKQAKEYEKSYEKGYGKESSSSNSGVLASFQNTMSDAWKSLTALGRSTRSINEKSSNNVAKDQSASKGGQSKSRSLGGSYGYGYEEIIKPSGGYVYFKVPRELVCI